MAKYWVANNPNSEITDAEAQKVEELSATGIALADMDAIKDKVFTTSTALAAAGTLAINTLYHVTDTDTAIYAMPATATKGDVIKIVYSVDLANAGIHDYGTAASFWAPSSNVFKQADAVLYAVVAKPDGTDDDFLKITGAANAGIGIGSWLQFVYNGSQWHAEGYLYGKGNAGTGVTAAFAETTG
jgi:hypothetical protein